MYFFGIRFALYSSLDQSRIDFSELAVYLGSVVGKLCFTEVGRLVALKVEVLIFL